MKHIFDWLREQVLMNRHSFGVRGIDGFHTVENVVSSIQIQRIINEAEAKWEADCCEWTFMEGVEDCRCGCNGYHVDYMVTTKYNFCPYCGKRIKISEVE